MNPRNAQRPLALLLGALASLPAFAEGPTETVVVSATKLPAEYSTLPAMVTVVTGNELRSRGARDLRTALSLVAGVEISPGGDGGPAGSVPALWGLREFDAFLLVVDGVPYGGAFNPALSTLDLTSIDRVEVLRGAAPVSYGATSFVGVIQVIHAAAGQAPTSVGMTLGSRSTVEVRAQTNLPGSDRLQHSLIVNAEQRDFSQADSNAAKAHLLYRASVATDAGQWRADVDLTNLRQDPYSPHPREGSGMSTRFPLDANVNPSDARQDQQRAQLNLNFSRRNDGTGFASRFSAAQTSGDTTRGFLRDGFTTNGSINADGFRQHQTITDAWLDLSWTQQPRANLRWVAGVDVLYGQGRQRSENFEYAVLPDGSNRPVSGARAIDERTWLDVRRNFLGAYAQADWDVTTRWKLLAGARLNRTHETRDGRLIASSAPNVTETSSDSRAATRPSGMLGTSYVLHRANADYVTAFADWRSTYKPAAADLGPEAEADILRPETGRSYEIGLRGRALAGRMSWETSAFDMDFRNLVIRENIGGLPRLASAGRERLRGIELETSFQFTADLRAVGTWAWHDSRFVDYARLRPDGSIQQLAGKNLELAPRTVGAAGLVFAPTRGLTASIVASYAGRRYLNKGNSVIAGAYTLLDAGLGWRSEHYELRIDGHNLTDRRDPVAESELGDPQFYRLPGRVVSASFNWRP